MNENTLALSKNDIMDDFVKKTGIKLTTRREIIYNILAQNSNKHFTAKDIESMTYRLNTPTSISTIYRTLELFEKWGIIIRHNFNDDSAIYEYAYKEDHHHLICKACGKVIEISGLVPNNLSEQLFKVGFHYISYNLKIYGYCNQCREHINKVALED